MATIKVKFRPSGVKGNPGTIYYQIIHKRRVNQMLTTYRVFAHEWDKRLSMIVTGVKNDRNELLLSIKREINLDVERFGKVIRQLDSEEMEYTAKDVISRYRLFAHQFSLFTYMNGIIVRLKENGRMRTSETYYSALRSFSKFREGEDLLLDSISSRIMEAYEGWLRQRGIAPNTVSFYIRILRAVYNRAVEEGIIENSYPFKHVYTGIDKTVKRALPVGIIKKITSLDLSGNHSLEYARDMFVLSFMFRGMSLIDMAFLKKTALNNGYLTYRRRKTGQLLVIKWTRQMQE
ncbi:MAG: site-specific integrase, partial [Paramuribaculum sp.]|nr:site-specific integrase [Paramuribaculum sp.]